MIKEFLTTLDVAQMLVLFYFVGYGLLHGIKYHFIVLYGIFSGRGYSSDMFTWICNTTWYINIFMLLYWFV